MRIFQKTLKALALLTLSVMTQMSLSAEVSRGDFSANEHPAAVQDGQKVLAKGIVTDEGNVPLPGVTVFVKGTSVGTTTDLDGRFSLYLPESAKEVTFSYMGYQEQSAPVEDGKVIHVVLKEDSETIAEAVHVGYGVQKKVSVTGAVTTANLTDVVKVSTPSMSNALAGQLPGIITRQSTGEPGYDAAQVFIRGMATWGDTNPLILVDGIERDMNQINSQEVESITILKDASATAVYGARGANGVILITTKKGKTGKPDITFRTESSMLTALRRPEYINGYEYASLMNEALAFAGEAPRWGPDELQKFKDGSDPYLYPSVNWMEELVKKNTFQTINNLSVSGGNDVITYYLNVGYTLQNGLWNTDPANKYNTNASINRYNFRNNVDVKLAKSLTMSLGLGAIIRNGNYPGWGSDALFSAINTISPIAYPKVNPDGSMGGEQTFVGWNPWGRSTQSGYRTEDHSTLQANLSLNWDLSFLLKGLSIRGMFAYDRTSITYNSRIKNFMVKRYLGKDEITGEDVYSAIYREEQPLAYSQSTSASRAQYSEAQINYNNTFGKHEVTAMVLFNQRDYRALTAGDSRSNLPYRRLGLAARATYSYADRYLVEFNCGYNGSENFAPGHRFGFFPSVSLGWVISNEKWFNVPFINNLKIRGSHGIVGNDVLGIRFGYLSTVKTDGQYYFFGANHILYRGMEENAMGNTELTWEKSHKTDIGLDLGLFDNRVVLQADYFREHREDILQQRNTIPNSTGIYPWSVPYGNIGIVDNEGFDAMLEIRNTTAGGFFYSFKANVTYAHNTVIENDEPKPVYPYLSGKGQSLGQTFGYVAEGFFESEEEIAASPKQTFSANVRPGDIKYKDINGDGVINSYDQVPIAFPRNPEFSFGFGGTIAYKGFDLSAYFTGAANTSLYLAGLGMWPFYDGMGTNNVLREYYDNRWTGPGCVAKYPAIDKGRNTNNYLVSNLWMRNGNYLRLRNAEFGYTFPQKLFEGTPVGYLRLFVNGTNLLTFDHIKIIDPESNDGTGRYPLQRGINIGLEINFR
ncbi:MAG: TonB-dependent receptor [Bacteroidales bacterium]|nr:TonB-dependent receptor [Bacteroidales bacterium]